MKNNKKKEKEKQENIQKMGEVIKNKNKITDETSKKIKAKIFENLIIAIVFALYFYFIYLGSQNIEANIFLTDLKVFSLGLLIIAIILFECSYKKDNGNLCIHGIEVLILAIITLFLIYIYSLYINRTFALIITSISIGSIIYFIIKSIIIFFKIKKVDFKSKNDIKEIIKK